MRLKQLVLVLIFLTSLLQAQKFQYGGMQQFSYFAGDKENELRLSIVNGIRFKHVFTGIGFDLKLSPRYSYYTGDYPSSAAYANGRYYFGKNKNFFAKVDQGINLIPTNLQNNQYETFKKRIGYYGDAGIGIKAKLGKEVFYTIDLSYGFRQTRYDRNYYDFWRRAWSTEKFDFQQYFLIVNLGLEIF